MCIYIERERETFTAFGHIVAEFVLPGDKRKDFVIVLCRKHTEQATTKNGTKEKEGERML